MQSYPVVGVFVSREGKLCQYDEDGSTQSSPPAAEKTEHRQQTFKPHNGEL